ncbi:MAG: hypothetical protein F7C33_01730 [Desulfurococcales archaeon]|nr:hypothetical protein [Desulfurococcales archaeon]
MRKTMALALITIILMIATPVLALKASTSGSATLEGSFGAQTSTVSYNITGELTEDTNTTLSLTATLSATETGTASINGNLHLTYQNPSLPEGSITYTKTITVSKNHFESHSQGEIYVNVTSLQSLETTTAHVLQLPGVGGGTGNNSNSTTPAPPPTPPIPGGNATLPGITAVYLSFESTSQGSYNGTHGDITATLHANFNIVGGASIVGLPGNATGTLQAQAHTVIVKTKAETTYKVVIAFNSGNQQVDAGLAALVYNYLKMEANKTRGEGEYTMNVTSNGTAITVTGKTVGFVSGFITPGIPLHGKKEHMPLVNITAVNTTGVPLFYENATATITVNLQAESSGGILTATGSLTGHIEGINPKALTFYPTQAELSLTLSNRNYKAGIYLKGTGDPATAYSIAKALAIATIHALNCESSTATVTLTTDGSVHFYNTETGEDLGTSIQLSCSNLEEIKHITVAPPNTTIKAAGNGIVEVGVKGKAHHVKLSLATIANAKVVVVMHSKKVVIETGKIVLSQPKVLVVKAGGNLAVQVKIYANTKVNGSLEVEALNHTEANTKAKAYGYTAAGAGVTVNGIEQGSATINLPANQTQGIAILEISHNGQVKLITNYKVEANGTVTFNATSFSTFIVVNANNQPAPTTTTTASQGQQGTTTSPATTSSGTSTSSKQTGTSTGTTTQTGSTSSSGPQQSASQPTTATGGKGGKGGSSTSMAVAAGIIIIVIIVAAAYALKK